jgi:hypothetical protein
MRADWAIVLVIRGSGTADASSEPGSGVCRKIAPQCGNTGRHSAPWPLHFAQLGFFSTPAFPLAISTNRSDFVAQELMNGADQAPRHNASEFAGKDHVNHLSANT